ncbi:hypothetical protein H2203_003243 [Taxawa tesnikishii (nom. ined.)]|nr:hypothetical protein H2203_003243 [Dothideales sp. JES 119]
MGDSERRFVDQFSHQQNESADTERQREYGGHWGAVEGHQHQSVTGATGDALKHAVGGFEDPSFRRDHTVDPNRTKSPGEHTRDPVWHGSVLIVTTPGQKSPTLRLGAAGRAQENLHERDASTTVEGTKLYEDPRKAFWRFDLAVPFQSHESSWTYSIDGMRLVSQTGSSPGEPRTFAVPAKTASMRILFHSCNGFSVGTDTDAWSGPALWNDVLRNHAQQPFHVMIGGGDQIYNDGVRVDGPLKPWTDIANPKRRKDFPFNEELRAQCDEYYFNNYLNIWDDHDIIDGFGSYTDHFMRCAVFRGIGGVAHKYYMLFQHHLPPPKSTFTTDAPATVHAAANGNGSTPADAVQLKDTWVATPQSEDPSYIIGKKPGPYVEERSRSIYCQLGARMAFVGIDARTERTRHQINYPETYDQIFSFTSQKLRASDGAIKHLILLLGVPIAYPRLQWLENMLSSPIIGPIRFLNRRFGIAGGFFNHFDGKVDLLDDLDDHYTAHQHKHERKELVQRLQALAKEHSVRITILGGDVHLGAIGRFYSNPNENIPAHMDWRYMPNIISSAITNKPPPAAVANLLARRNKIHHLDHETDETLLNIFDKNPGAGMEGVKPKTADKNHCTMPSRNYAMISESHDHGATTANGHATADGVDGVDGAHAATARADDPTPASVKNTRFAIHAGEVDAGTAHPAASGLRRTRLGGQYGLDVCLRGHTEGYGFSIPALDASAYKGRGEKW